MLFNFKSRIKLHEIQHSRDKRGQFISPKGLTPSWLFHICLINYFYYHIIDPIMPSFKKMDDFKKMGVSKKLMGVSKYIHICMYVCVYVCMYVCMYVCIYIYIYKVM